VLKARGSHNLAAIYKEAISQGYKVAISGQGADEIISDYGWNGKKLAKTSGFGGFFPDDLTQIFPYRNFYNGAQVKYLNKEECVGGSFGIETRYPFLDKLLVQEFLWLRPELKNRSYKAPVEWYLDENKFPYEKGKKIGFAVRPAVRKGVSMRFFKLKFIQILGSLRWRFDAWRQGYYTEKSNSHKM